MNTNEKNRSGFFNDMATAISLSKVAVDPLIDMMSIASIHFPVKATIYDLLSRVRCSNTLNCEPITICVMYLQHAYPAIADVYKKEHSNLLQKMKEHSNKNGGVHLCADGQYFSPGFSSTFGCVSVGWPGEGNFYLYKQKTYKILFRKNCCNRNVAQVRIRLLFHKY